MSSPADPVRTGVEGIAAIPLDIVVTETGHVTKDVIVAVLVADLDALQARAAAAESALVVERERREAAEAEVARRMGPTASAVWIERCREAEAERDRLRAGIERSAVDHDRRADGSQWVPFIRTHRQAATELRSLLAGSGVKEEPNV